MAKKLPLVINKAKALTALEQRILQLQYRKQEHDRNKVAVEKACEVYQQKVHKLAQEMLRKRLKENTNPALHCAVNSTCVHISTIVSLSAEQIAALGPEPIRPYDDDYSDNAVMESIQRLIQLLELAEGDSVPDSLLERFTRSI